MDRRETVTATCVEELEERIGYRFQNPAFALRALSHRSLNSERRQGRDVMAEHNEQLEFLGDSVLGLLISDYLFRNFPALPEGQLSIQKANLVSANHLVKVAQAIDLGPCLQIGRGEELSGGRQKRALLSDTLEAVLGAVYLDGGLEEARGMVERLIIPLPEARNEAGDIYNFKACLQELAQAKGLPQPIYVTVGSEGPEHSKTFTIEAQVGLQWREQGIGVTKKAAGQMAARSLYERMCSEASPD